LGHEGKRILELLASQNLTTADLARAANVSWSAAAKWTMAERVGSNAWETCSRGLRAVGIDSDLVRPARVVTDDRVAIDQVKAACDLYNRFSDMLKEEGWSRRRVGASGRLNLGDWWYWRHPDHGESVPMDAAIFLALKGR